MPFESGQLSTSSDVYSHEIPGGQYTNLLFQSRQLGLTDQWPLIKQTYAVANKLLGDIPKVTPPPRSWATLRSSWSRRASRRSRSSITPRPLPSPSRSSATSRAPWACPPAAGESCEPSARAPSPAYTARRLQVVRGPPRCLIEAYDFDEEAKLLRARYGERRIREQDCLSYAMYPKVFEDWKTFEDVYGQVEERPTHLFLKPMVEGQEVELPRSKRGATSSSSSSRCRRPTRTAAR